MASMRQVSEETLNLIKYFEGLHKVYGNTIIPYRDAVGFWTIGYGHLITRDRSLKPFPNGLKIESISELHATKVLLAEDLEKFERGVIRLIKVPLTDGQFGALVSFSFNLGLGSLQASTLRKKVNEENHEEASKQFNRWVFAGGRKLKGLVLRRRAESQLYLS